MPFNQKYKSKALGLTLSPPSHTEIITLGLSFTKNKVQ